MPELCASAWEHVGLCHPQGWAEGWAKVERNPAILSCTYSQKGFGKSLSFSLSKTDFFSLLPSFLPIVPQFMVSIMF